MAGHSKFKNIMHRKGAQDAKRAKIFTRLGKELSVAVKQGVDPEANPRLRAAIAACKAANMPKDNIEKVLKKAEMGDLSDYSEIRYEGFGPDGVAIIVEALTDNKNRTASEVRTVFNKFNGNLGENGCVSYLFDRIGSIIYPSNSNDFEEFLDWFSTEEQCLNYLERIRWPDGFICPKCNGADFLKTKRNLFHCTSCNKQTSITAGTVFEDSRKSLRIWFHVAWVMMC